MSKIFREATDFDVSIFFVMRKALAQNKFRIECHTCYLECRIGHDLIVIYFQG